MYKYDIYLCCTDEVIICITGILTTNKHCIKQKGVCVCVLLIMYVNMVKVWLMSIAGPMQLLARTRFVLAYTEL